VNEKANKDELRAEIERGNFSRAALLAAVLGLPEAEIRELRMKALWQISAVFRNAPGTRRLAQQYGLSRKEVSQFLEERTEKIRNGEDARALEPCYDHNTTRYLSFQEWMDRLLKTWDKLPES
jgi:hypothetical protein